MRYLMITNSSNGSALGSKIRIADSFLSRFVGLMGRRSLPREGGLLLDPSSGVHTFWMRFPIDILALDSERQVVRMERAVRPWRLSCVHRGVRSVLELPAGTIDRTGTRIGDRLAWKLSDKTD